VAGAITGLRRILLVDDPTSTTVITATGTRPAWAGERHAFDALGKALTSATGVPADVRTDFAEAVQPGTALVIDPSLLERLVAERGEAVAWTVVVDAPREAVAPMLELQGVAGVVETHQFWKWKTAGPANAALYGHLTVAAQLDRDVEVTPIGDGRFGRIRIGDGDLPGLLGDYLRVLTAAAA
jgi:hypothetical protein